MNEIILTHTGHIECNQRSLGSNPLIYLNYQVELKESFTLRSYFKMFDLYPVLGETNEFLPEIRNQYKSCPEQGCSWEDIEYLEFGKTVEMIGFPSDPRLEVYNALRGMRGDESCELKTILLEGFLDIPVRLGKLKHIVFGDKVDVFEFETVFTLFEIIDGITWELSFQASPNACNVRR